MHACSTYIISKEIVLAPQLASRSVGLNFVDAWILADHMRHWTSFNILMTNLVHSTNKMTRKKCKQRYHTFAALFLGIFATLFCLKGALSFEQTNCALGNGAVGRDREARRAVHGQLVAVRPAKALQLEEIGARVAPLLVLVYVPEAPHELLDPAPHHRRLGVRA